VQWLVIRTCLPKISSSSAARARSSTCRFTAAIQAACHQRKLPAPFTQPPLRQHDHRKLGLVGTWFPSGTGTVGWVAVCGHPLLVDDVSGNPQFARDAAASTGYTPRSIMATPLIEDGSCLGVLEVLDRNSRLRGELGDVDLLGLLSTQVAIALELLVRLPRLDGQGPGTGHPDVVLLQRAAERLPTAAAPVPWQTPGPVGRGPFIRQVSFPALSSMPGHGGPGCWLSCGSPNRGSQDRSHR
jgi:GAF domain-containing protein